MKYRVKKRCQLLYPDGTVRGEAGYVIDSSSAIEFETIDRQGQVLEPCRDRQTPASAFDVSKLMQPYDSSAQAAKAPEESLTNEVNGEEEKSFAEGVIDLVLKGWNKMPKENEDIEE
jgi:hypothetical protein